MVFKDTFNNILVISWQLIFICGGNQSIQRKPQTFRKSLTNFITSPWVVFELMMQVVIGTKYIGSCKSKYHTIMLYKLFSMYAYLLFDFISKSVQYNVNFTISSRVCFILSYYIKKCRLTDLNKKKGKIKQIK